MRRKVAWFAMWVVLSTGAPPRGSAQEAELAVGEGDIRVDGEIESVNPRAGNLILRVRAFTLPDGRSSTLANPKPKLVNVSDQTSLHRRGDESAKLALGDLKPGWSAAAVGPDLGSGKALPARELAVSVPGSGGDGPAVAELLRSLDVKAKYMTVSPDGNWLAVIPTGPEREALTGVLIYDVAGWREVRQYQVGVSRFNSASFSPRGDLLAATVGFAGGDASFGLKLWDTATWAERPLDLQGHTGASYWSVGFSADGSRVASGSWSGEVVVWDIATGKVLFAAQDMRPPAPSIGSLSPDGLHLITEGVGATGNQVTIWDLTTKKKERIFPGDVATYLPDGKRLVVSSAESRAITLWDTTTWQQTHSLKGPFQSLISPDGKLVATIAEHQGAPATTVWDVSAAWKKLYTVAGQAWAFSPSSHTVAVLSEDNTGLYDARTGRAVASLKGGWPCFRPDGHTALTLTAEGTVNVWRVPGEGR